MKVGGSRDQLDRWNLAARLDLNDWRIIACISQVFRDMSAGRLIRHKSAVRGVFHWIYISYLWARS